MVEQFKAMATLMWPQNRQHMPLRSVSQSLAVRERERQTTTQFTVSVLPFTASEVLFQVIFFSMNGNFFSPMITIFVIHSNVKSIDSLETAIRTAILIPHSPEL